MTGVSECSQQRGNLKDNGYKMEGNYVSCLYPAYQTEAGCRVLVDCSNVAGLRAFAIMEPGLRPFRLYSR
ncbi:hypothetical protein [Photorhabdus bodei]|uniref:hypothetical protein n=1 Tax=Photorhabdus bodei TaxID=2029681 RepID=UPI001EFC35E2|nr:hypothetical protein [Photorhabdus bodei]